MPPENGWPMSDCDLLAKLLANTADPAGTAVRLLHGNGGTLRRVVDAPSSKLLETKGVGPRTVDLIKAVVPAAARVLESGIVGSRILMGGTKDVVRFAKAKYHGETREKMGVVFLNARHQVIGFDWLFLGTIDRANVYPRVLAKAALERNAASVVLMHDHMSDSAEPSRSDEELTSRLSGILEDLDIRLLDHVVVAANSKTVSMAERGML